MKGKIPQELINRINELSKKKKSVGLTKEELVEQKSLREDYLAAFRSTFRSNVEMLQVFNKEGKEVTPEKVKEIQRKKGLRDD
ncbi:DUF896 domain-containing protein [Liquorilactobacillus mali]|uniref:UPF0291 protein IV36_GL002207 n=1 Tax=Liquorilactobacillus mali TaxID=1618 RepID=A0A0R2FPV2_9LACO|nr:DUF896 domain-containing protein [Liquorilactobacillus mali]KRN30448.1 hypothetical protein IV36_GL002207 [Liquorilactobacillus mali]MDN7144606.1 DUF896 domain-containing protein [Liquorilactobacillus mali]